MTSISSVGNPHDRYAITDQKIKSLLPIKDMNELEKKVADAALAVSLATPTPVTIPIPPNNNLWRGMFTWVTSNPAQDPLLNDTTQQNLLNFCSANGVNMIFLDMFQYLGTGNTNGGKRAALRNFLSTAHNSGILVHALAGDPSYAINQQYVKKNLLQNLAWFNTTPTGGQFNAKFDGFIYDCEYWTDSNQTAQTSCPQLCDLVNFTKKTLNLPVGVFASFFLKDNTQSRPTITYQGKTAQDGEFLMDNADYVVTGAYRNHAQDNQTDGPGQITLFQPWYDYASQIGNNYLLYCGSETQPNQNPSYTSYAGSTKSFMETQHTLISNAFTGNSNNGVFVGQAVDTYDGWKAMPA